jgi:methylmalonyl-CoA mutase N-terminal domain/subunit
VELKNIASTDKNLMPKILECVENKVTLGEIAFALRDVFGEFKSA